MITANSVIIVLWLAKKYCYWDSQSRELPSFRTLICSGDDDNDNDGVDGKKTEQLSWRRFTETELEAAKTGLKEEYSERRNSVRRFCRSRSRSRNVTEKVKSLWRARIW